MYLAIHSITGEIIQGYLGGKATILGGDIVCYSEKKVRLNVCLILKGCRDIDV
jgi:hypothetical protein